MATVVVSSSSVYLIVFVYVFHWLTCICWSLEALLCKSAADFGSCEVAFVDVVY